MPRGRFVGDDVQLDASNGVGRKERGAVKPTSRFIAYDRCTKRPQCVAGLPGMPKNGSLAMLFLRKKSLGFNQLLLSAVLAAAGEEASENFLVGHLIRQP
jgi:hypothetical protein